MKNHIQKVHPTTYKRYLDDEVTESPKLKKLKLSTNPSVSSSASHSASILGKDEATNNTETASKQSVGRITSHFRVLPPVNIPKPVYVRRDTVVEAILRMVTVDMRPLTIVRDSWFRAFASPYEKALDLKLDYRFVIECIDDAYDELSNVLKKTLANMMFSLKADCVTRLDRSFIGINVQFTFKGEVMIVTLGTVQLLNNHTGLYLRNTIVNKLKEFDLTLDQIYTLTTDNGSDLCSAASLIEDLTNKEKVIEPDLNDLSESEFDWDDDKEYGNGQEQEDERNEILNDITYAADTIAELENIEWEGNILLSKFMFPFFYIIIHNLLRNLNITLKLLYSIQLFTDLRCAAHVFQLAITDLLYKTKDPVTKSYLPIISCVRNVVKVIRHPNMANLRRKHRLLKPILDCPTR